MATIDEKIDSCEARRKERSPPPVVVLRTQMEIAQQNGSLRTSDNQNDKYQEEETKHVVHLVGPNRGKNKEELNEDTAEG